jgi:hypothetical protein
VAGESIVAVEIDKIPNPKPPYEWRHNDRTCTWELGYRIPDTSYLDMDPISKRLGQLFNGRVIVLSVTDELLECVPDGYILNLYTEMLT